MKLPIGVYFLVGVFFLQLYVRFSLLFSMEEEEEDVEEEKEEEEA